MSDQTPTTALVAGLRISLASIAWTVVAGGGAIGFGISLASLSLVAFGALNVIDAAGSLALVMHFRHSLAHEAISARHERRALVVVTGGMVTLGIATIIDSALRLASHASSNTSWAGVVVPAASVVVLLRLSMAKRHIAKRIPSHALRSDGLLSATGAMLAGVTLIGLVLRDRFGWWWADATASVVVATYAIVLGVVLAKMGERTPSPLD